MADDADIANDLMEHALQLSLSRFSTREKNKPSTDECEDCGDQIEAARRLALPYARRCIACQSAMEKSDRMYR